MRVPPYDRRTFLKHSGYLMLASTAAFNFGCSISPQLDGKKEKVALLYGTRYGATRETAEWICKGITAKVDILDIETVDFEAAAKRYDKFIVGSGIWVDGAHKRLVEFLNVHKADVDGKVVAAFIVCGTTGEKEAGRARLQMYFERFLKPLDRKPQLQAHLGGRMVIEKLSEKDRKLLENFYKNVVKKPFEDWDRTDPAKAQEFGRTVTAHVWAKGVNAS